MKEMRKVLNYFPNNDGVIFFLNRQSIKKFWPDLCHKKKVGQKKI